MFSSNYVLNESKSFYNQQSFKLLVTKASDAQKIKDLESSCSKWAETISNWDLPLKIAIFILTLPLAPVVVTMYATTRYIDNQTKNKIKKIQKEYISESKKILIIRQFGKCEGADSYLNFLKQAFPKTTHTTKFEKVINGYNYFIPAGSTQGVRHLEKMDTLHETVVVPFFGGDHLKAWQFLNIFSRKKQILDKADNNLDAPLNLMEILRERFKNNEFEILKFLDVYNNSDLGKQHKLLNNLPKVCIDRAWMV